MTPFAEIQAVSFDVGGTLIEPWPSVGHVYATVALEAGLPSLEPGLINESFAKVWRARGMFDYTRASWFEIVRAVFSDLTPDAVEVEGLFNRLYDRFAEGCVWQIYPEVHSVLSALRQRGMKVAAISNWDERLRPLLRRLQLERHFDVIAVSGEIGFHKPAPEIFRWTLDALGLAAPQVLHIGDTLNEDVRGAQGVGMMGLILRRGGQGGTREEVRSLSEVLERLPDRSR